MMLKSEFLMTLSERGFIHQCTDFEALDSAFQDSPVTAFAGFDATADSLHVGHLLPLLALRWMQKLGGSPIILVGGGTTKVGDPSFRDDARPLLGDEQIAANAASLSRVFPRVLDTRPGPGGAIQVDNADWLEPLRFLAFLREVGTHFTVNRMLAFDSVRQRLDRESPLTLLEFNYMVLQAFDFVELSRQHDCRLQIGGSDQWGNIVNGVELARKTDRRTLFGLTTPLLTTSSGTKMGKSAGRAVWLNADRMPPFEFWQFWRNAEDPDVGRFLGLFTDIPMGEVRRLGALRGAEINEAKVVLAREVTSLIHGEPAATAAELAARDGAAGAAFASLPAADLARHRLDEGVEIIQLLLENGLATSRSDGRRLIRGGGARLNGAPVTSETARVGAGDLRDGCLVLEVGRRRQVVLRTS